jgi:hypothetical protein
MITLPALAACSRLVPRLRHQGPVRSFACAFGGTHSVRLALECIGNRDALYHNVEHTMLVTLAGHDIFKGRALLKPSTPTDYSNFIVACLVHDTGYVRGVVEGDKHDGYVIDGTGRKISLPRGFSDAALGPYHVERSQLFVLDRVAAGTRRRTDRTSNRTHAFPIPHLCPRSLNANGLCWRSLFPTIIR